MHEEILINVTPQETRIAVVENGMMQELHIERTRNKGIVGNIYLGKVKRVLPGMQAAFIDIGQERTAFLHANDLTPRTIMQPQLQQMDQETQIKSLISEAQEILVQVVKDPIGTKGARLTAHISIPSRNIVLFPKDVHISISQRIQNSEKRLELLQKFRECVSAANVSGGYILRTVGENASAEALNSEMVFLNRLWNNLIRNIQQSKAPQLIYQSLPLASRFVRDLDWSKVERLRIDSRETCENIKELVQDLTPEAVGRIEHYPGARPIFDLYGIEDEIHKALQRKVPLKSGGHLVIDQTEAMAIIDINTGSYVGGRNLEETIFKTNLEAVSALTRQLRLRNLGGIIIVDFIDMALPEHSDQVMHTLKRELNRDTSRTFVSEMSSLGLVEITRKRTRDSLSHLLTETCSTCEGRGGLKAPQTICYEIFREILRTAREYDATEYLVIACPQVIDMLLEDESSGITELEYFIRCVINLQVDPIYHQEKYDVILT